MMATVNSVLKWVILSVIIYNSLPMFLGIFPRTKNFAGILFGYILNPVKKIAGAFWKYLPNLITIVVILIIFRFILKVIHFLKSEIERVNLKLAGFYPDRANPTYQIIKVLAVAFIIIIIYPYVPGSGSTVFNGVSVFMGFLLTFGSAGSLSNIISGLVLTYMR
jgi:hypothetical protein